MSDLPTQSIRFAELPNRKRTQFNIQPDAAGRKALAEALDVLAVRKFVFQGAVVPVGKRDWRIEASLGATVSQACVVTLDPVTTRIDDLVERTFIAALPFPVETEIEVPEDDTTEPMPDTLDLVDVALEALALALPTYPRKDGITSEVIAVTEPGKKVMTDEDARPFAGLAALRAGLAKNDDDTG